MLIDCDCHILPKDAFDYIGGKLASRRPILQFAPGGGLSGVDFPGRPIEVPGTTSRAFGGAGSGAALSGLYDIGSRMEDYERMCVDRQVVAPQLGGWWNYLIEPDLGTAMAHSYNLAMLRLKSEHPHKIDAVAQVALQDVSSAIDEIAWASEQGFKAVVVDHTFPVHDHPFGEPTPTRREIWPFFQKAEELNLPVYFHACQHGHRLRNLQMLQRDGIADVFLPPLIDHQLALVACITTGLLDAFPELKIIHTEMFTGFIPELIRKMDARFHQSPSVVQQPPEDGPYPAPGGGAGLFRFLSHEEAAAKNKLPPSHYFKKNFYFTIEAEEPELLDAVRCLGVEHFLFATDYPHDDPGGLMKFKDAELLNSYDGLSTDEKELIGSGNARSLFALDQ